MKYWEANSILNYQTEETPPKEIFQAVCDAIGQYFETKGYKYSRSTPKIVKKNNDYKLEIRFHSSASNYAGGYVNLEINSYLYSIELAKMDKTKNKFKGIITGIITPLNKILPTEYKDVSRVVETINGEIIKYPLGKYDNKAYKYNRNVNLYKIDDELFEKILKFIEDRIIKWYIEFIETENLIPIISNMGGSARHSIDRPNFYSYLKIRGIENIEEIENEIKKNR